ncbi:hypothetical protein ACSQ67_024925 [Phaseolus vulgaris]
MQEKMQEEMEAKLKQQVEAMKIDLLNNIKSAFTQLQSCIPGVMTQDLQEEIVVEKSEDLTVGVVTLEKDLKTLQHPSTAIELFMQFMEEKDGKSSSMISSVGSDFSAFVSASVVEMEELA